MSDTVIGKHDPDMMTLSAGDGRIDTLGVTRSYARWAPIYDLVFGWVFARGRLAAVAAVDRVGGRVLEVGVGTGLSLPRYRADTRLLGIDISEPMLKRARERARRYGLGNIEDLVVMDAEKLDFPDGSFDVVVAQYVVTAVPHPERALEEFARVVKPGGTIILTTRLGAEHGLRGTIERLLSPLVNRLGWRTEFPWSRYVDWAQGAAGIEIAECRPLPPLGHFALVRMTKRP